MSCDNKIEIPNFQSCECSAFARADEINSFNGKLWGLLWKAQTSFGTGSDTHNFFTQLMDLFRKSSNLLGNLEFSFNDLNLDEQVQMVDGFSTSYSSIENSFNGYLSQQWGSCSKGCDDYNVLLTSDCSCYWSTATSDYFNLLYKYATFDQDILTYQGSGPADELQGFAQRSINARDNFHVLYQYLANNGANYDQGFFDAQKNEISNTIDTLMQDFKEWMLKNNPTQAPTEPPPPCAENCDFNTQIADKSSCQCVTINGWDTMQGYPNTFNAINNQINNLGDESAKAPLRENL